MSLADNQHHLIVGRGLAPAANLNKQPLISIFHEFLCKIPFCRTDCITATRYYQHLFCVTFRHCGIFRREQAPALHLHDRQRIRQSADTVNRAVAQTHKKENWQIKPICQLLYTICRFYAKNIMLVCGFLHLLIGYFFFFSSPPVSSVSHFAVSTSSETSPKLLR